MIQKAVSRITRMERDLDAVVEAFSLRGAKTQSDPAVQEKLNRLSAYMDSGQWLEDYRLDEAGKLPSGLKRGVLAEDTLYDLLTEHVFTKDE